jgi:acyl-coenzyme A synthetase/AMP-(fatty) acid ligase
VHDGKKEGFDVDIQKGEIDAAETSAGSKGGGESGHEGIYMQRDEETNGNVKRKEDKDGLMQRDEEDKNGVLNPKNVQKEEDKSGVMNSESPSHVIYTSGTTGQPKVTHTHTHTHMHTHTHSHTSEGHMHTHTHTHTHTSPSHVIYTSGATGQPKVTLMILKQQTYAHTRTCT